MSINAENWVDEYGDYLYRFAFSRVHDREIAEDIVQETFLAALKNIETYDGRVEFRYWLRGILRNKTVDHIRKSVRETPVEKLQIHDEAPNRLMKWAGIPERAVQAWNFSPDQHYENKEFWGTFQTCLSKMKPSLRQLYTLKEIEGLDTKEICKEFDISSNNLWVIIHRARKQLKHCLMENWGNR